jgi:hypothetical protein
MSMLRRVAGAALVLTVAAAALAPAAGAAPTPLTVGNRTVVCTQQRLPLLRTKVAAAAGRHLTEVHQLQNRAASAKDLSASDRSALQGDLASVAGALQDVQQEAGGAGTCAALGSALRALVATRVYAVAVPKTHLVVAADTEAAVVRLFQSNLPRVEAAVNRAEAKGADGATLSRALSDLKAQLAGAAQASSGVAATVLAVTAASYPNSTATLQGAHGQLRKGAAALRQAGKDLHTILSALRAQIRAGAAARKAARAAKGAAPAPANPGTSTSLPTLGGPSTTAPPAPRSSTSTTRPAGTTTAPSTTSTTAG